MSIPLTSCPSSLIVSLAHQLLVVHQVELVPSGELSGAYETGEALQMIHVLLSPSHHLGGRDWLIATSATSTKFPVECV